MSLTSAVSYTSYWTDPSQISRYVVYNNLPVFLPVRCDVTEETHHQASILFDTHILSSIKSYKIAHKKAFFQQLFHAGKRAVYHGGCVLANRNKNHRNFSRIELQVIDAAVKSGLFVEYRSPPGSPKMSRLLPSKNLDITVDPWIFDPNTIEQFVYLQKRGGDKEEIPFDQNNSIAAMYQKKLDLVNDVNSLYAITYKKWNEWEKRFGAIRQLRPIHYAVFTETFDMHGRIYTGKYGHQGLSKTERLTIRFKDVLGVEKDFSGMHPRLLYHLSDMEYREDPYLLWNEKTTEPMRLLAKLLINALINAKTRKAAISACNQKMSAYCKKRDESGNRVKKTGKALTDARNLYTAYQKVKQDTGMTFTEMCPLIYRKHKRIQHHFGSDMGIYLMRKDSEIALGVLSFFAEQCIPCLGCHDSFIVPFYAEDELLQAMYEVYHKKIGYKPLIK